jgi:lipoprotein-anchoring transpeptidase ErfK/SrfK
MTKPRSTHTDKHGARVVNVATFLLITLAIVGAVLTAGFVGFTLLGNQGEDAINQEQRTVTGDDSESQSVGLTTAEKLEAANPQEESFISVIPTATATKNPIRPKQIREGSTINRGMWTPTPLPTPTPKPSPTPYPTFVAGSGENARFQPVGLSPTERWIDVDLTNQTLVAYHGLLPVFDSPISSGLPKWPTVTGQFRIWLRFQAQDMNGRRLGYDYYLKNVPFVQYFYQDYALHGTFWHNNFGRPMSHGCVNLPTPAAEWLFDWAEYGTLVNIHY